MDSTNNNIVLVTPVTYLRGRGSRGTESNIACSINELRRIHHFLCWIKCDPSPWWVFCGILWALGEDSATHTFVRCKTFDGEWEVHVGKTDLFYPSDLVPRMLEFSTSWETVVTFVEIVISPKEEVRRARDLRKESKTSSSSRCGRCTRIFPCIT